VNYSPLTTASRPNFAKIDSGANKTGRDGFLNIFNSNFRVANKSFITHQFFCPESMGSHLGRRPGANKNQRWWRAAHADRCFSCIFADRRDKSATD
jgi:hypothetical protein